MAFSFDNYFLATKNDKMPNILFIWDINQMNLQFVLIQLNEVIHFEWAKNKNILFISTNNNKLYYFTLDSCKILKLTKDFNNKSLLFSSDGKKMMIRDTNNFIMVNLENEEEGRNSKEMGEEYSNENMKVEENYVINSKDENNENLNEDEIDDGEEGENMEEQMQSEDNSPDKKINKKIVFVEEEGMNPDSNC